MAPILLGLACPETSAECLSAADCREDEICLEQVCRRACNSNADCTSHERCLNGACLPAGPESDAGSIDQGRADNVQSDTAAADSASSDHTSADHAGPDVSAIDAGLLDSSQPDSAPPDSRQPDSRQPDSAQPDAAVADVTSSDTNIADAAVADSATDSFPDPWWDPAWPQRMRLRVHNVERRETVTDLTLMIRLVPENFDYGSEPAGAEGLRFVDDSGMLLRHEVERWQPGDESILWVTIPELEPACAESYLYLYHGNPNPPPSATGSAWPADTELVVLFSGATVEDMLTDSSAQQRAVTGQVLSHASGMHGQAVEMLAEEELSVSSLHNLAFPQTAGTWSLWVQSLDWSVANISLLDEWDSSRAHLWLGAWEDSLYLTAAVGDGGGGDTNLTAAVPWSGWTLLHVVWDTTATPPTVSLYRGGNLRDSDTLPDGWAPSEQELRFFGSYSDTDVLYVDSVRLDRVARSAAWISTQWDADRDRVVIYEARPFPPEPEQGTAGSAVAPVVLYEFDEAAGAVVHDSSGVDAPLDLTIADPSAVDWLGGALRVHHATVMESSGPATKITAACRASGAVSVEAWLQPDNGLQVGPARIVTMGQNTGQADFMLGQTLQTLSRAHPRYAFRLRTDSTDNQGRYYDGQSHHDLNSADLAAHSPRQARTQVVFVYDGAQLCSYVDGSPSPDGCMSWGGGIDSVWQDYVLKLGNEFDGVSQDYGRPWLGTYYRVAVYCEALSAAEVLTHYQAGTGP